MRFIDTHTHFYDERLLPDADAAVQRALDAGVEKMIQADVDGGERDLMWEIGRKYPGILFQMAGLYPGSVNEDWRNDLDLVRDAALHRPVVAIGEVGLDYHEGLEFAKEQKEVLRLQLELASELDLPVNIHLRDAVEDFLGVLKDCRGLQLRGNLHCFSASYELYEQANRYADLSVGIGGVVTFKNSRLPETLKRIPMEKILLETDAPYLAPTPLRGTRNESANIPLIAAKIAEVKGLGLEEVAAQTTANAEKLFRI